MSQEIKESKQVKDKIKQTDQFQLVVNDSKKFNKSFISLAMEHAFLGWATNFKWKGFSIMQNIKNSFTFTLKPQALQTLDDTQIRVVGDYILVRGYLCSFEQIILDYNGSVSEDAIMRRLASISSFIEFLKNIDFLEFFWYDRDEILEDYSSYFRQMQKIKENIKCYDPVGFAVTKRLYNDLENWISEMIEENKFDTSREDKDGKKIIKGNKRALRDHTRIRDCFLNIAVPCSGGSIKVVEESIAELEKKRSMILKALIDAEIKSQEVKGDHLYWFLTNFVSLDVRF
jgi:hypothetical protein